MKRVSTLFLRVIISLIGIGTLALCILWLPGLAARDAAANPDTAYLQYPFLICAYVLFIPFFIALYQAFKLLNYIDGNMVFSMSSVKALKNIKICALVFSVLVVLGTLFVIVFIEGDRAGVIALGIYTTVASSIFVTFTAVLQKLLQNAVDLKSENDLTV